MYNEVDKKLLGVIKGMNAGEEIKDYIEIVNIDFPIVYVYETMKGLYLGYVIDYSFKRGITVLDVELSGYNDVNKLLDDTSKEGVRHIYEQDDSRTLRGYHSEKGLMEKIKLTTNVDIYEALEREHGNGYIVSDLIPKANFLIPKIINKIDIYKVQKYIETK